VLPVVVVLVIAEVAVAGDVLGVGLVCAEHKPAMPRDNAARARMFSFFIVIMLPSFGLVLLPGTLQSWSGGPSQFEHFARSAVSKARIIFARVALSGPIRVPVA